VDEHGSGVLNGNDATFLGVSGMCEANLKTKGRLNSDLDAINTWFSLNKLSLNISIYSTKSLGECFSDIALVVKLMTE